MARDLELCMVSTRLRWDAMALDRFSLLFRCGERHPKAMSDALVCAWRVVVGLLVY
jgi:hypothetical protein